ncbi:MAG: MmcQ/YjbR family DNA-binding protein [Acidimicrobiia bacterium]
MVTTADVRRVALSLPATTEKPSYGTPGFRVKAKLFARIREEGDVLVVWCADVAEKEALIASQPATFFTTPHYDGHPTVLERLGAVDVDELAEVLTESWRIRAPKKLREEFDAASG